MNIIGLSYDELQGYLNALGLPSFRAKQLWNWVYFQGAQRFDQMTNLSKPLQQQLEKHFSIERPLITKAQRSSDGTQKWLLRFKDHEEAETVFIPEVDRGTLCISSQVGCTLTCRFCHTGTQLFVRNLHADEIVGQVIVARDVFNEWPTPTNKRHISNIVMMGMGEPFYNYENVSKAIQIMMDPEGLSISKRKITLSTSGVVPFIDRCGKELGVNLAISLHAVRNELRNILVPLNKKYPLEDLLEACRRYPKLTNSRRITFEYVMLKGVNDSSSDAKELIRLIKGIPSKINLIPFNTWPGTNFECSSFETIQAFSEILYKAGYTSPVRMPRGRDILAACGQLKSLSERKRKTTH
ncbi:MAG: 23S rRNA (adenine(2503)-C(2))-methyltransferase RlmN [Proteobacteria bacterium]|nr:23S rRNA (adenine(2503)-C(2))-methyltransferase RlmN [Pseudomonadota bacterium]